VVYFGGKHKLDNYLIDDLSDNYEIKTSEEIKEKLFEMSNDFKENGYIEDENEIYTLINLFDDYIITQVESGSDYGTQIK